MTKAPASVALLLLSVSGFSSAVSAAECINSTDVIFDAENDPNANFTVLREYVLCPDTTFDIGYWSDDAGGYTNGQAALDLGYPNMHVLCGEDGKRENNCVLRGGYEQVFIANFGDDLTNVLVKGVTFREAEAKVINARAKGEVVFDDCVFEDNTGVSGVVESIPQDVPGGGKTNDPLEMSVTFDSCTFRANSAKTIENNRIFGLVWNEDSRMKIKDCDFIDNRAVVDDPINQDFTSFVIANVGTAVSEMDISGCTFRNNTVSAMLVYEELNATTTVSDTIAVDNTFYETKMTDESCAGLATKIGSGAFQFDCEKFPVTLETLAPTNPPTKSDDQGDGTGAGTDNSSSAIGLMAAKRGWIVNVILMPLAGAIAMVFGL